MKKKIYAIGLALLLGALIIQSVWGAEVKPLPSGASTAHLP